MAKSICKHLGINGGKKSDIVQFPKIDQTLDRHFLRGYFDGDGCITIDKKVKCPQCQIASSSKDMLNSIAKKYGGRIYKNNKSIGWASQNCVNILETMYNDSKISLNRKRNMCYHVSSWSPSLRGKIKKSNNLNRLLKVTKCNIEAIVSLDIRDDNCYDVYGIYLARDMNYMQLYGTGLKITPKEGIFFNICAHEDLLEKGYVVANSAGIIQHSDIGEIYIPLIKIDSSKPDLVLPAKIAKLVPRKIIPFDIIETDELSETNRGEKGFGSSG